MPTNGETGITPLGDGPAFTWSPETVTEEAAELFRSQAAAGVYRVEALREHADGSATVTKSDVPGGWLHAFLFDLEDAPCEGETVLSAEAVE
jgi:hypothetical protein